MAQRWYAKKNFDNNNFIRYLDVLEVKKWFTIFQVNITKKDLINCHRPLYYHHNVSNNTFHIFLTFSEYIKFLEKADKFYV